MTWAVTSQFTTLNPAIGAVEIPEWGGVAECTEQEARHFFKMWVTTKQFKKRTIVLWEDGQVVDVKFV